MKASPFFCSCGKDNASQATSCIACGKSLEAITPGQISLSPTNVARRRMIVGGLLTGTALIAGGGGALAFLPRPRVEAQVAARHATPASFAPDVMFGFDAQHSGFNPSERQISPANVSHLKLAWRSQAIGINYFSSPVVSAGVVYVGTSFGQLCAFNAATGRTLWITGAKSPSALNVSTAAVAHGIVYTCLQDERLYAFDAVTGKLRWASPANSPVNTSPIIADGIVYAEGEALAGEGLYAFDAITGKLRWVFAGGASAFSPVAIANHLVYMTVSGNGPAEGRVYALNVANGKLHWISDLIKNGIDDNSSPTVANNMVYIGSGEGGLAAFDAATGHTRWVTADLRGSTGSSPAVAYGRAYLSNDKVYAFNAKTGHVLWISDTIGAYNADSTMVANGVVYVGSAGNNCIYALNAATGKTLWQSPRTNGQIFTTPTIANGMLYLASQDNTGEVYAFHLPSH